MMRPSNPGPTGTAIGSPVSVTSWPRTRPSDESIATVRTVDSPRCCATSSTRRLPPFLVSSAFRIAGRWSSNCTSTTAPMTCVIFPTALGVAMSSLVTELKRLGAGDNLDQFFGDHRLTRAVVSERLLSDHLACVARGAVHRAHACALLRGGILKKRAEQLHGKVTRQKLGEDLVLFRLVFIGSACAVFGAIFKYRRNDLLRGWNLRHDRPELGEEKRADVEGALVEQRYDLFGDHLGLFKADCANTTKLDRFDDQFSVEAAQLVVAFSPYAKNLDLFALIDQRIHLFAGQPHDRRVERPAKATFRGADHQQMHSVGAGAGQQFRRRIAAGHRRGNRAQHFPHALGERTRRFRCSLCTAQLGRRNHLHGLGDLLRRLGGGDANAHVLKAGHVVRVPVAPYAAIRRMSWRNRRPSLRAWSHRHPTGRRSCGCCRADRRAWCAAASAARFRKDAHGQLPSDRDSR